MRVVRDVADILPNPRRHQPDYSLTISTAQHFTPNNTLVFIGTHQENGSTPTEGATTTIPIPFLDATEPIYGTPFHNATIPEYLLGYWNYTEAWDTKYSELTLAGDNMFIPRNYSLLPPPLESKPELLSLTSSETWVLTDTGLFPEPRASFTCELRSGSNETSVLREALSELFVAFATTRLEHRLFGAGELGYIFKVKSTDRGLTLEFAGLSDKDILHQIISDTMNGKS
jgi:secreted Zn-dependent insulinase-like peptidase